MLCWASPFSVGIRGRMDMMHKLWSATVLEAYRPHFHSIKVSLSNSMQPDYHDHHLYPGISWPQNGPKAVEAPSQAHQCSYSL